MEYSQSERQVAEFMGGEYQRRYDDLEGMTDQILRLMRGGTMARITIGELLTKAKPLVRHGLWLKYLKANFAWSDRVAQRFMQLYDSFKCADLAALERISSSGLDLLAQATTPPEVRARFLASAADGETVSHALIKAAIKDAKRGESERAQREKLSLESRMQRHVEVYGLKYASNLADKLGEDELDDGLVIAQQWLVFASELCDEVKRHSKNKRDRQRRRDKKAVEQLAA